MNVVSTMTSLMGDIDKTMTGDEDYPIIGTRLGELRGRYIIREFGRRKFNRLWNCLEKAAVAWKHIGEGVIMLGSFHVISGDGKSLFGYAYNPPLEFHAWIELDGNEIVDVALPGVIEKGLSTFDDVGPMLVGRKPIILAGLPPEWLIYKPYRKILLEKET